MYLTTKWFGTFLIYDNKIKEKILFPKKVEDISHRLKKIESKQILSEEKELVKNKKVKVIERRLCKLGDYDPDIVLSNNIDINPEKYGYSNELLQKALIVLSKQGIKEKLGSNDLQIIQMVNSLDDLIQTYNLLSERLSSWNEITKSKLNKKPLLEVQQKIKVEIKNFEELIKNNISKIAPNTTFLVGPLISARLISLAGGLDKLACLPASTIQILGAEKALFRYKKEGGKPPKHGIIFQHPMINKSPKNLRGKIARVFSTKISIATKADYFTGRDLSQLLKEELERRVKEIKKQ